MVQRFAIANGFASDPAIWNGGTLPGPNDDIYTNNFIVTIDENVTWLSLRNAAGGTALAGGSAILNDGVTLTANIFTGLIPCVVYSGVLNATIIGNLTGGAAVDANAVNHVSSGQLVVVGNCIGGSATDACGVVPTMGGTLNITGNCIGGSGLNARGAKGSGTGFLTLNGDAIAAFGQGLTASNGCTAMINGNAIASATASGTIAAQGSTVIINGNAVGGDGGAASGAQSNNLGTTVVNGYAVGSATGAGPGVAAAGSGVVLICKARCGATGSFPTSGTVQFMNPYSTTFEVRNTALASGILAAAGTLTRGFPLSRLVQ